jgi:ubiquinone/menaquinone biosynthesis C-methylase UbiE
VDQDWRRLDESASSDVQLAFLDELASGSLVRSAKERSYDLLDPEPGHIVLDAGCGTGADILGLLARVVPGGSVVGVDASRRALEVAQARTRNAAGVSLVHGDLTALPFDAGSFDAVRADRVLLHVSEPETAVAELVRVARRGGRVVVTEAAYAEQGRPRKTGARREGRQVLEFLPYLLARAGATAIGVDRVSGAIELSEPLRAALGTEATEATLEVVTVSGRVG